VRCGLRASNHGATLSGVPDYNIKPFDPHHCSYVELRRGESQGLGSFRLILRNVSEYGWARSEVTKFHADPEDQRIVYTQYFPDKSLEGEYEFAAKMLGTEMNRKGHWNLTLYDYRWAPSCMEICISQAVLQTPVLLLAFGLQIDSTAPKMTTYRSLYFLPQSNHQR